MTYAILKVAASSYADIRRRLVDIDERIGRGPVYQTEYIRPADAGWKRPEHIVFGTVGLEAAAPTEEEVRDLAKRLCQALREDDASAYIQDIVLGQSTSIDGLFNLENVARKLLGAS